MSGRRASEEDAAGDGASLGGKQARMSGRRASEEDAAGDGASLGRRVYEGKRARLRGPGRWSVAGDECGWVYEGSRTRAFNAARNGRRAFRVKYRS